MENKKPRLIFVPIYGIVFLSVMLLALLGSKTVSVISATAPLKGRHTVIIDAGHGGEDGGATSCSGVLESAINLEIALRLNDFMRFMGYNTLMVRTSDTALHTQGDTIAARKASDLKARVALANNTENCLWISVHQNYFSDGRYSGAQVFYGSTPDSDILGKALQTNLIKTINQTSKRQAKKISGVYLFDHMKCTGILVECGFISNREEEEKLRSADYQKAICGVIAATVGTFLS